MIDIATTDLSEYRRCSRTWLAEVAPQHELPLGKIDDADEVRRGREWQRALFDGRYAGILLPKRDGGQGGSIAEAVTFAEEEQRYRVPRGAYLGIGLGMAVPVVLKHGTPEQIAEFVVPTLKGELTWCQLFSEPAAGSDLAGVRTRAVRDGDEWVVNGQKVWSSWAHQSDWGILLVRTDPSVPKHKGLTFFLIDMKTSGIDIRPIRQISGASDFNETFLTDVRIPDSCRVGEVGGGWACAMTTLMGERLNTGGAEGLGMAGLIDLASRTPRGGGSALDGAAVRVSLGQALAEEMAEKQFQARLRAMVMRGENPGALSSIVKLASASRLQKTSGLAMEIRAMAGLAHSDDPAVAQVWHDYIYATALRVAGGADEVLRNQLAERVLGMPGEIRADKDRAFDQL